MMTMNRLSFLVLLLLGSQQVHGLRVHLSPEAQRARVAATRRSACAAAAALLATTAGTANAEHRLSFVEARQEEKEDKQAAKLLKNTSVEEMIAMSIRNKELELGRPLEDDEKAAVAAKVKAMLGVA